MNTTNPTGNTPDYLQYLSTQMPGFPQTGGQGSPAAQMPQSGSLSSLLGILGADPAAAAQGAQGVQETQGTQAAQRANAKGQKYTGQTAASLPPPRAPRTQMTAKTQAAYNSFAQELGTAQQNSQTRLVNDPAMAQYTQRPQGSVSLSTNPEQAAHTVGTWVQNAMLGNAAIQGDLMTEFMTLRLKNSSQGMQELNNLSSLCTSLQDDQLKEEEAKSRQADQEAHKAQNKAQQMSTMSTVMTIIIAIITAIVAVFTLGLGLGLALVGAAAAMAFVIGGAVKGKKEGKGFDAQGGLEIATYVADGVMMALGIGAALMAAQVVLKEGVQAAVTSAAKAVATDLEKEVAEDVTKKAGQELIGQAKDGGKFFLKQAQKAGFRVSEQTAKDTAKDAAKTGAKTVEKEAAERGGETAAKTAAKSGSEAGEESAGQITAQMTKQQALEEMQRQMREKLVKEVGDMTIRDKIDAVVVNLKSAFKGNMSKITGKQVVPNMNYGAKMATIGILGGGTQGGDLLASGVINYQTTMHQTNSEEDQAVIKMLSNIVDMMNNEYSTLQDSIQAQTQSHSKAVDATESMLKNNQQVNMLLANNLVSR